MHTVICSRVVGRDRGGRDPATRHPRAGVEDSSSSRTESQLTPISLLTLSANFLAESAASLATFST